MTTNDGQRRHDDNGDSNPVPSAPKVTLCPTYENNRNDLTCHHSYADAGIKLSGYKPVSSKIKS